MRELKSETQVLRLRRVGVKAGAEIIRVMRSLGWNPRR
jgi:hypothetical protein